MTAQPIKTAPRNGKVVILFTATGAGAGEIAKAFWHRYDDGSGMWAYALPEGADLIQQVDYEPTHWSHDVRDFIDNPDLTLAP